jgi:hypothetical protein
MDYNDGQIHGWNGGECPVHPDSEVKAWTDEGADYRHAKNWNDEETPIVAFKVTKPYVEPKTIWVNEYPVGFYACYSEEEAKQKAGWNAIRIAVKYTEAKE